MSVRSDCPACGQHTVADGVCYAPGCTYVPAELRSLTAHLVDGYDPHREARAAALRAAVLCEGCGGQLLYDGERCTCGRQPQDDVAESDRAAIAEAEAELAADPLYQQVMRTWPVDANRELERRWAGWMAEARAHYAP